MGGYVKDKFESKYYQQASKHQNNKTEFTKMQRNASDRKSEIMRELQKVNYGKSIRL